MKTKNLLMAGLAVAALTYAPAGAQVQPNAPAFAAGTFPAMPSKPTRTGKHINPVIDMWLKGQPVYYAQLEAGGYEDGKRMANTKADYITYEMEHGALDFHELREFMRGLKEVGTRTGHPTVPVIVTLPIQGTADVVRANAWMIQQALAAGAHGILLCNAESPEAAKIMVEASRYPFAPVVPGLSQGFRGNGSQSYASKIWGITPAEYLQRAEPWPLNPDGEIILGLKIMASIWWAIRPRQAAAATWPPTWWRCADACWMPPRRRGSSSSTPATR